MFFNEDLARTLRVFVTAAATSLLVLVAVLGLLGIVLLPLALILLLVAPLLDDLCGLGTLHLADRVALALAHFVALTLLLAAPLVVLLDALFAVTAFLVASSFLRVVSTVRG